MYIGVYFKVSYRIVTYRLCILKYRIVLSCIGVYSEVVMCRRLASVSFLQLSCVASYRCVFCSIALYRSVSHRIGVYL